MKTLKRFTLILFVALVTQTKAQSISCTAFCITNIQLDSLSPNTLNVTIQYVSDSNSEYINYPYISTIIDPNGDTIATGSMNFFVQESNTSQTYSLSTTLSSIPSNFYCTAYFNHDTTICTLSYPCPGNFITTCSAFCITDMQIDSAGFIDASIHLTGHNDEFITYSYISAITDANGDTIAIGYLALFGQFGNTIQTYQANTSLSSLPADFSCNVHFTYNSTVCILPYPCTPLKIEEEELLADPIHVYPNPVSSSEILNIKNSGGLLNSTLKVINSAGQTIVNQNINTSSDTFTINLSDNNFVPGIYYLVSSTKNRTSTTKFIVR